MTDAPASYSGTSYYSGHNDGGRGEPSRTDRAAASYQSPRGAHDTGYSPPAINRRVRPGDDVHTDRQPGYAVDGYSVDGHRGARVGAPGPVAPERSVTERPSRANTRAGARRAARQRGLPHWGALLVLIGIAAIGGLVDVATSTSGGFNVALIIGSILAILLVRHRDMFFVVVAPPLVYAVGFGLQIYLRTDGLKRHGVLISLAGDLLVYGFPAIAGATAGVLIIAGIRMVLGK